MEPPKEENEAQSLENPSNSLEQQPGSGAASGTKASVVSSASGGAKKGFNLQAIITSINIYFLIFILIVVIAVVVVFIGVQRSKKEAVTPTISTQKLTQEELQKLQSTDSKVGGAKQTLSIESNAIFAGKVLLRDSLDVAGTLKVGSTLTVPGLNVSGSSTFDQLLANKLSITGDATIQGQLNIQKNLVTSGGASFGGQVSAPQLTIQSLQLSGDLTLSRHIDAAGGTPGISNGSAMGPGGTSSVSGTDTAGTVAINTSGSPAVGCFATINFTQKFNTTPHVVITPVGSGAAGINYYINRSSSNFSICTTNAPPGGTSFSFDYIVID